MTLTTTGTTFGPYGYQWQLNGTNIAGATGSTLTITNLSLTNQGDYTVIVTNQAGDWWESSDSTLVVSNVYIGITMQPMSQMAYEPDTVTFAVTAAGTNLTYQWQAFDPGSGTFTNIPNANGDRYMLYNIQYGYGVLQSGQVGTFDVVISNGVGSISAAAQRSQTWGRLTRFFRSCPSSGRVKTTHLRAIRLIPSALLTTAFQEARMARLISMATQLSKGERSLNSTMTCQPMLG